MVDQLRVVLFLVLSLVAVACSAASWRAKQTHGIYRFLAFETLVFLIAWNAGRWFREPLSMPQIASWASFAAATALAAHGFHLLRVVGRAQERLIEDTQTVVEVGAYRYIRHPLYASLVLFGWGVFLKGADVLSCALALSATALFAVTARHEEAFNTDRFGAAYSEYMKRTKMFIPFLL